MDTVSVSTCSSNTHEKKVLKYFYTTNVSYDWYFEIKFCKKKQKKKKMKLII